MTVIPARRTFGFVAALSAFALLTGCGLSAEFDRERNPERRPTPTPTRTAPPAPVAPAPSPSASASVPVQRAEGCPASGLRFVADEGNAAMGLRAMGLDVINCGEKTRELNGYPAITVLDGSGAPFPEVRTVEGTDKVPMASKDPGPRRLTLAPGESAHASLYWRMHAEDGVYLRVAAKQGEATATIRPPYPLDIGPDNVLGTTAWQPSP